MVETVEVPQGEVETTMAFTDGQVHPVATWDATVAGKGRTIILLAKAWISISYGR